MSPPVRERAVLPMSPLVLGPPVLAPRVRARVKRAFFAACQKGSWLEVSRLMEAGALLLWVDGAELSPLHYACLGNNYNVAMNFFQENGKTYTQVLNWRSKADETPLLMACRLGCADMVDLFVDRSAGSSTMANRAGETPLHAACVYGHEPVARRLLVHWNVDVNAKDRAGNSPLLSACLNNEVGVVGTLLENRADVNCANRNLSGYTPLFVAVIKGNRDIVELILYRSNPDLTATDIGGRTALHHACELNREHIVTALIAHGARVHSLDGSRCTPLHYACKGFRPNVVRALLAAGAEANVVNSRNETPLVLASRNGQTKLVKVLLELGAKVHVENVDADPLQIAIRDRHFHTAKAITDHFQGTCSEKGVVNRLLSHLTDRVVARLTRSDVFCSAGCVGNPAYFMAVSIIQPTLWLCR